MRKLIVLPGNSQKNLEWGAGAAAHFGTLFDESYAQAYDHWETGSDLIDFPREIEKLNAVVASDGSGVEYTIVAKSAGTILTLMTVAQRVIEPARCVFFGMPLQWAEKDDLFAGDWHTLESFRVPTIAFHDTNDPVASYEFTAKMLRELEVSSIELILREGDTHAYTEFEQYADTVRKFLGEK